MSDIVDERNARALLGEIEKLQAKAAQHEARFEEQLLFTTSLQASVSKLSDQVMGLLVSRATMQQDLDAVTEKVNDGDLH